MEIQWISKNENGDFYDGYKIKVSRGMHGKTKSKVDEVMIVGIPQSKFDAWCKAYGIFVKVENKETGEVVCYGSSD